MVCSGSQVGAPPKIIRPGAKLPTERMYEIVSCKTGWPARVVLRAAAGSVDQSFVLGPPRLLLVIAWSQLCMQGKSSLWTEVS